MVYILHISDLHFVKNAASYHTEEILVQEAARKLKNVPRGKKLLIITGDFHNFWEKDYDKAEVFLKRIVSEMDIDIQQDVFVIPGNHDVGNEDALKPLLELKDPLWKKHMKSCLAMLKDGDKDYIEERLQAFRLYNKFVQNIGIYDINKGEDFPASSHVRSWRGNLNILHLNSALIADGKQKDNQIMDVDKAANPETWEQYYDKRIPALAIGHNNFFDLSKDQRMNLSLSFYQKNVSAYLCGDRHRTEQDPEHQMIRIESGHKHGEEIPNLVAAKSIADEDDKYSEVGYCWHYWDEKNDKVTVEFRKWARINLGNTVPAGEKGEYYMRREKIDGSDRGEMVERDEKPSEVSKESTQIPLTMIPTSVDLIGREDDITAIRDVLTYTVLAETFIKLGDEYKEREDYAKAQEQYEKACVIREKILGLEHPDTATTYSNIAVAYHNQGNFPKAQKYYEKARVIREKVLGLGHPDTARSYYEEAWSYLENNQFERAKYYYQMAYKCYLKAFGSNHPDTVFIKHLLDTWDQE